MLEKLLTLHRDAINRYVEAAGVDARSRLKCRDIGGTRVEPYDIQYPLTFQRDRIRKIRDTLAIVGIDLETVQFIHVPHHRAHAASVYFTSGLRDALIVTLDGKGDNLCGLVVRGDNGRISVMHEIDYVHSIGHFYTAITVILGFTPIRHEGKVMGLAATGQVDRQMLREFESLFRVVDGTIVSRLNDGLPLGPYPHTLYGDHVELICAIVGGKPIADIAATGAATSGADHRRVRKSADPRRRDSTLAPGRRGYLRMFA